MDVKDAYGLLSEPIVLNHEQSRDPMFFEQGDLIGVITDGDLRRNIERGLDHEAAEFMTRKPKTIGAEALVDDALRLFDDYRITALFVVNGTKPVGVLHIHDCPAQR